MIGRLEAHQDRVQESCTMELPCRFRCFLGRNPLATDDDDRFTIGDELQSAGAGKAAIEHHEVIGAGHRFGDLGDTPLLGGTAGGDTAAPAPTPAPAPAPVAERSTSATNQTPSNNYKTKPSDVPKKLSTPAAILLPLVALITVLTLIFSHRYKICIIEQNISRHKHWIVKETGISLKTFCYLVFISMGLH